MTRTNKYNTKNLLYHIKNTFSKKKKIKTVFEINLY